MFRQHFSTLLLQTLKSTILSNPPEQQAHQHIVFFSSSKLTEVTNRLENENETKRTDLILIYITKFLVFCGFAVFEFLNF